MSSCTQISFYDEYTSEWDLDLPQPVNVSFGELIDSMPKEYDNFDLVFTYHDNVELFNQACCIELSDEERYDTISSMYELYQFEKGNTIEKKRQILEEHLKIDLGPGAKIYKQVTQREHVILLPRLNPLEIYMLRMVN